MRLIDADKLIEELCKQETELARHGIMLVKGEYSLYKIINSQPTASRWIPVNMRLPENDTDKEYFVKTNSYRVTVGKYYCDDWMVGGEIARHVIAWMPIPK